MSWMHRNNECSSPFILRLMTNMVEQTQRQNNLFFFGFFMVYESIKIIIPMQKCQKSPKPIIFSLNRLKIGCYYTTINVDLTPIQRPNHNFESIIPKYNQDGNYFTPSFLLPCDQDNLKKTLQGQRQKFEERTQKSNQMPSIKSLEQRSPSSNFCQICKQNFQNYPQHCEEHSHLRNLRASKANVYMRQLIKKFAPKVEKTVAPQKNKKIRKGWKPTKTNITEFTASSSKQQNHQAEQVQESQKQILPKTNCVAIQTGI